jgi:hypothetical protein
MILFFPSILKSNTLQENERCGNNIEISAGSASNGACVSTGHSTEAVAPASQTNRVLLTTSQAANPDLALLGKASHNQFSILFSKYSIKQNKSNL